MAIRVFSTESGELIMVTKVDGSQIVDIKGS